MGNSGNDQVFVLDDEKKTEFELFGGCTLCSRVMSNYLARENTERGETKDGITFSENVLEVGSGTGLVGTVLAHLGAHVTLTDQEPVLPMLTANLNKRTADLRSRVDVRELLWGEQAQPMADEDWEYLIGSDLIYAHENI